MSQRLAEIRMVAEGVDHRPDLSSLLRMCSSDRGRSREA
jgi:hypothetical protein